MSIRPGLSVNRAEQAFIQLMMRGLLQNGLPIAAIALAHGVTIVTHNLDEFKRVPDLILEDWQA